MEIGNLDLLLRILGAAIFGGLIGFEREFSDQPAGFRTHMLVCLGAALFSLAGAYGLELTGPGGDPTRVAAQVVTGIGFLGAGAIMRQGFSVRGLTTAAALWVTAAIGVAVGLGNWPAAGLTTTVTLLALFGLKPVEKNLFAQMGVTRSTFVIATTPGFSITTLERLLQERSSKIRSVEVSNTEEGQQRTTLSVDLDRRADAASVAQEMSRLEGVTDAEWRD